MAPRSPDQRNYYYLIEAARTGIHKPILAALYAAQRKPPLTDGETGLGIAPANRIPPDRVNTFPEQVQYAANTIRSLIDKLTAEGWQGHDLWLAEAGRYSDRFLHIVAQGYSPSTTDPHAARLEPSDATALSQAYLADWEQDFQAGKLPQNLAYLDKALLAFLERVPSSYQRLAYQREALLEAVRIWRKLESHEAVAIALNVPQIDAQFDEDELDKGLIDFANQADHYFSGYPNQREALIRLVQLWHELDSREAAIQILSAEDPYPPDDTLDRLDPALMAFVQRLPQGYRGRGDQRFALTEGFRLWHGLDSRDTALKALGIDPQVLADSASDPQAVARLAPQLDRALFAFWDKVPTQYEGTEQQRDALLRLVSIWRKLENRPQAIQSLLEDLRRMERANRNSIDAMPPPPPAALPRRPSRWTPDNLVMAQSILPGGNFTWSEATRGGTRMPPDQATVDAIVRIATLAQEARDRIGRPFCITCWYRPAETNARVAGASISRHIIGDAIDFYCDGLTGRQLYWALDPWWPGGLGRYSQFPYLCYLDARGERSRWVH